MKTIIKWPGGKSKEFRRIENLIPDFDRYIEPFFGGGAVFFKLKPQNAYINDISELLMNFYRLVQNQDTSLHNYLISYNTTFQSLLETTDMYYESILTCYNNNGNDSIEQLVNNIINESVLDPTIILHSSDYIKYITQMVTDKFQRTSRNNEKKPFTDEDLKNNLKTGFLSGYYMYFRDIYNKLALGELRMNMAYTVANFYFIREYCYGSMFRYNSKGEFNIPYGGISYNNKDFMHKINNLFNTEINELFENVEIYNMDFELFINQLNLTENDFIFLDPPYDTEFSDYEGRDFTKTDQQRLANTLMQTRARFILIIKNTDFIFNLYKDEFRILSFNNSYTYNMRSRNDRDVEHLIITNIPE